MPDTNYIATSAELTETADAIREKTGDSSPIEWEEGTGFASAIADIPSGGSPVEGLTNAIEFRSFMSFTLSVNGANWNGTVEWTDGVQPWAVWDGSTLTASDGVLYLRGTNNTHFASSTSSYTQFSLTGIVISCRGNIETLLDYDTVAIGQHPVMDNYCFCRLFYGCTALATAPALPATDLSEYCYYMMFYGCGSLISAPTLPATTLKRGCYNTMFYNCYNLTSAPALPATTLAVNCYYHMFYLCKGLTSAPALPATTLASSCYSGMFTSCAALTSAPALPATTLASNCYDSMFFSCGSLTSAPALPATTLASGCYYSMFQSCSKLESVPALPATTLATDCYYNMFRSCSRIKISETYDSVSYPYTFRIPKSGNGTTASSALSYMFTSTGGSFKGTPSINTDYYINYPPVEATP